MPKMIAATLLSLSLLSSWQAVAMPIPRNFASNGPDKVAIQALLDTYTAAVSTKNQDLFETLLLNKNIPFSDVFTAVQSKGAAGGTEHYADFAKSVFAGPPFKQRFQDVHIAQDGSLAEVSLVFVNTDTRGSTWGWKTMQLLKIAGEWKIAAEFYTGHSG